MAAMLGEHVQGRKFTAGLKEAAEPWEKGDLQATAITVQNARNYVSLLRQHIQKENMIRFPWQKNNTCSTAGSGGCRY